QVMLWFGHAVKLRPLMGLSKTYGARSRSGSMTSKSHAQPGSPVFGRSAPSRGSAPCWSWPGSRLAEPPSSKRPAAGDRGGPDTIASTAPAGAHRQDDAVALHFKHPRLGNPIQPRIIRSNE